MHHNSPYSGSFSPLLLSLLLPPLSPSSSLWRFSFIGGYSGRHLTSPPFPVFLLPFSPFPFAALFPSRPVFPLNVIGGRGPFPSHWALYLSVGGALLFSTWQIDERVLLQPTRLPAGLFVNPLHLHPFPCFFSPTGGCVRPAFSFRWARDVERRIRREWRTNEKKKETMTIMASHGPHLPLSHLGLRRRSRRTSFPSPSDQPPRRRDLPRPAVALRDAATTAIRRD